VKRHGVTGWLTIFGALLSVVAALVGARAQTTATQGSPAGSGAATGGTASASPAAQPGEKLTEEQFKNIQVLKGIPADQLIPAMQFIAASLGVECEHCHDREAMDKDDKKPKRIARQMMTMMLDIDRNNFEGRLEVTCYSCHRGAAVPVSIPAIKEEDVAIGAEGKKPSEKAALPKAEDLLARYLAAVGGAGAVEKITSRVQKGKLTAFGGQTFPVDMYSKAPGKRISLIHLQGGDSVTAFDGQRGWQSVPGRPAHMMSASENDAARVDADLHFPIHVKAMYQIFNVESGEKIDGYDTYLVEGFAEGHGGGARPPLRLYFDKQRGLLLRLVRYAQSPLGLNPTQIDYADYREADGVKAPFRWTLARPGNRFTIQVEEMRQNVPVDDAKFAAPAPTPPPQIPGTPPGAPSGAVGGQKPPAR
jgi:photosynthetic reaction center cytochrome c subunit